MKTCDHWFEDDEGRPQAKCEAPAHYTTCDPIGGVTCERHKCRCAKPLPAEDRIEALEREVRHLRARVRGLAKRRKGLLYALRCMQAGRSKDNKQLYPYVRRAFEAEKLLKLAMTEGLKAVGVARANAAPSFATRAFAWLKGE